MDEIKNLELPYTVETTEERCQAANGENCGIMQAVVLTVKLQFFSWKVRFLFLSTDQSLMF
jgi:hypothetical protein